MITINLREFYPDCYTEDTFVEVSDDVAAFLLEEKRLQTNYAQYIRDNKAFYSLDAGDGIESDALHRPEQPDEAYMRAEMKRVLDEALASLPEKQRRRVLAHIIMEVQMTDIAEAEHVHESSVRESVRRAKSNLRNILKKLL